MSAGKRLRQFEAIAAATARWQRELLVSAGDTADPGPTAGTTAATERSETRQPNGTTGLGRATRDEQS